ncbi:DUF1992 domain-containing protein [Bacillus shivajii]|uniref:DnaJ family domain-containing protein n=1 Tax=Bacillus shivajii TaxID=1983719 RepID=UPI001CFAC438|nr:DUF1992 domain-containing protein [Bacillus shivajii]UCZ53602.1 DUF1992 domain-containing protein [Bacillus shivajii]
MNHEDYKSRDLIGGMYKDHEKKGGFDNLPGKGKPLTHEQLNSDPLNSVLKNAGFLPEWVKLQHKVRDLVADYIFKRDKGFFNEKEAKKYLKNINQQVKKYNRHCPYSLQKPPITADSIDKEKARWQ